MKNSPLKSVLLILLLFAAFAQAQTQLPNGEVGVPYTANLTEYLTYAEDYHITDWDLPLGLEITYVGGKEIHIEGTPSVEGFYSFYLLSETTSLGGFFIIDVAKPLPPMFETFSLDIGSVGEFYYCSIDVRNATEFALEGSLPNDFMYDFYPSQNYISIKGPAAISGDFTFNVKIKNKVGEEAEQEFTIKILPPLPPQITTETLPSAEVGISYYAYIDIGSYAECSLENSNLPNYFHIEYNYEQCYLWADDGDLTAGGPYTFTVKAANESNVATKTYTISVLEPQLPVIVTQSLPKGYVGEFYNEIIEITGSFDKNNPDHGVFTGHTLLSGGFYEPFYNEWQGGLIISGYNIRPAGTYYITVWATNAAGTTDEKTFTLEIETPPKPVITTHTLPDVEYGENYEQKIATITTVTGSSTQYNLSGLPYGFYECTDNNNNSYPLEIYICSSVDKETGEFDIVISSTNAGGTSTEIVRLNIPTPPAPTFSSTYLPNGMVGETYGECFHLNGIANELIRVSGNLPAGLLFGQYGSYCIEGTPITAGTYNFTLRAGGPGGYNTQEFTITIAAQAEPEFVTNNLPSGDVGEFYEAFISTRYNSEFSLKAGSSLPAGLSGCFDDINFGTSSDCYIYGQLEEAGTFTFTVVATNAIASTEKSFTISVAMPLPPIIATTSLPNGMLGEFYSADIISTSSALFSIESGNLPEGLYLNGYGLSTISGTPETAGTSTFTVVATNAAGSSEPKQFSITIAELSKPEITISSLPNGTAGEDYYYDLRDASTSSTAWWSLSGEIPSGYFRILGGECFYQGCYIRGMDLEEGEYTFMLVATNDAGSTEKEVTLKIVAAQKPVITISSLPNGEVGAYYSEDLCEEECSSSWVWSIESGSLPAGLSLSSHGWAMISGTPAAAGSSTFTLKASNSAGDGTKQLSITITAPTTPQIITATLPNGEVGGFYGASLESTSPSARWSITAGSLPQGLSISDDGDIYGTPRAAGTSAFTVVATNAAGSSEPRQFTITIGAMQETLTITTLALPNGNVGEYYGEDLASTSLAAVWTLESGSLPAGLHLDSYGYIYGTPTAEGSGTFTLKAQNAIASDTKQFTITIVTPQEIPPTPIRHPQIAANSIRAYAANGSIVLENLPSEAKVEVYNLQGKRVYANAGAKNLLPIQSAMHIPLQTKGMYIVRVGTQSFRIAVR